MAHLYRPELPAAPPRIAALPIDERGYPVPWFVAWVDGKPDHRIADARKLVLAIRERHCWVCGQVLGVYLHFVIGPMCAVNRISAEPPLHRECAEYSVRACPFLTRPCAHRRDHGMPDAVTDPAGSMIRRNPGVMLIWATQSCRPVSDGRGGVLFGLGEPESLTCFAEGRAATTEEIRESFDTGLPLLREVAEQEGADAVAALAEQAAVGRTLLGLDAIV